MWQINPFLLVSFLFLLFFLFFYDNLNLIFCSGENRCAYLCLQLSFLLFLELHFSLSLYEALLGPIIKILISSIQGHNQDFASLKMENFCDVILMTYCR